jgi:uncharacterized membrane protein YqjE
VSDVIRSPRADARRATEPLEPDRSLTELLGRLSQDFSDLVTAQVELAKVELKEDATEAARSAGMMAGAGLAALLALLLLSMAAAWGLSEIIPEGAAFAIVGALWVIVAAVLFAVGRERARRIEPVPQTRESVKEDLQWAKQQMS